MAATLPLDERIPITLTQPRTSAQVAAVRDEAEQALADLIARADAADVASLSPLATREQASRLRNEATELRWEADRLEASTAALSARAANLREAEAAAVRDAKVAEITAERDALAADIARDYPRIVGELTALVQRINASDTRCASHNIVSAEAVGRNVSGNFMHQSGPIQRIYAAHLGMPDSAHFAWQAHPMQGWIYRGLALAPTAGKGADSEAA